MKYLQEYREEKQTALFNETNSFFAFSTEQFNKQKKEGLKYVSLGAGMICEKSQVKTLIEGLDKINAEAIAEDLKENGKEAIIIRELYDYESFYTYDYTTALNVLKGYDITEEEVFKVFKKEYPNYEKANS